MLLVYNWGAGSTALIEDEDITRAVQSHGCPLLFRVDSIALGEEMHLDLVRRETEENESMTEDCARGQAIGIFVGDDQRVLSSVGTRHGQTNDVRSGLGGEKYQERMMFLAVSICALGAGHWTEPSCS